MEGSVTKCASKVVVALGLGATGFIVKPSIIYDAGFGSFAARTFGKGETAGWYFYPLVYSFLLGKNQTRKDYRYGYMV